MYDGIRTMNYNKILLLIFLFLCKFLLISSVLHNVDFVNMTEKLKNIYEKKVVFDQGYVLIVIQYDPYNLSNELLKYVYKSEKIKVLIIDNTIGCNTRSLFRKQQKGNNFGSLQLSYLFIESSTEALNLTLSCLEQTVLWKPRQNTVLVLSKETQKNTIKDMFKLCWSKKILNAISIFPFNNIITYNPFFNKFYEEISEKNIFYNKLQNLNGFQINLLLIKPDDPTKVKLKRIGNVTEYSGKDGLTILNILKHYNATFSVVNIQEIMGWKNPFRSTFRNAAEDMKLKIIKNYSTEIFFLSQEMMTNNNVSEMIYPHAADDWKFLVPRAGIIPQYELLFNYFINGLSIIFGFILIICPIIWFLIQVVENCILQNHYSKMSKFISIIFDNFRIMLGSCLDKIGNHSAENIFFIYLLYCDLIITNYFQSILYSILTVVQYEPEINTIQEFIDSDLYIHSVQNIYDEVVRNFQNSSLNKLLTKFVLIDLNNLPPNMNYTVGILNWCSLINQDRAELWVEKRPYFRIVKESVIPAYITFHVTKYSPYYEILEKNVPRLLENGIYEYWKRSNLYLEVLQDGIIYDVDDFLTGYADLTMYQFRASIYLYLFGIALSIIVFLIEVFINIAEK